MTTAQGKPSLVILHGWGLSQEKFKPLVDVLKHAHYDVYAPDFPGFGQSKMPDKPLTLGDYAVFLHEYIASLHLVKPVLIGHSFGGRVSLKYNYLYPNNVRALILTGTPGFTPVSRKKLVIYIALAKVGKWILSVPPLNLIKDSMRKWYYYVVGAREYLKASEVMRETFKNIVQEKLETPMKANTAPTLLLWGENDYITPTRIPKQMHAVMPHAKFTIVPNADHGLPYKQPQVFAKYVQSFIQSL
jgi:pimeloyl-ACP methyl ester carboxylesterase